MNKEKHIIKCTYTDIDGKKYEYEEEAKKIEIKITQTDKTNTIIEKYGKKR